MKKFLLGTFVGLALSLPISTLADDVQNIVGKKVDGTFPVSVGGFPIPQEAIVIEGTSYLPVRSMGEMLGYNVGFTGDRITLEKPTQQAVKEETPKVDAQENVQDKINTLKSQISQLQVRISGMETGIRKKPDDENVPMWQSQIAQDQASLEQLQQELESLEAS